MLTVMTDEPYPLLNLACRLLKKLGAVPLAGKQMRLSPVLQDTVD